MAAPCVELPKGGFSFDNCARNARLEQLGLKFPTAYKTGTTIAGAIFKDGVVLGADTRATEDTVVADKNCAKIHYLSDNMYCCGAGTAADTEMTTQLISAELELHRLNTGRVPRVATANRLLKQMLYRYQGHIGAALVLGGVDVTGPNLYSIWPHGSTDKLPYVTMGSGSLAAMATFEDRFKPDMTREEAMKLVRDAIAAGIFNDLGSGSNVDLCVITKDKVEYIRPYEVANIRGVKQRSYRYQRGTTAILSSEVKKLDLDVFGTEVKHQPMDTQ
ncbi:proteasome subunit beta type-7 [Biomphalaria glabrata]|uniref:proteasome endopeptidase complex n=2 Tax=Biomphalaria TaxID=6525 RepID=A0A2C9JIC4_BIOGL|nr:proteasome subunit beta type-7-like [Biomphalaria glabrata]KAI8739472.1 proteasome subunit beta type-7-like [Biomphalaria glabrata]KAI8771731.1 proteasome subunit beta type-7 [Biomphalaria glabrata]KAK0063976.1 proteasome subunit beta type-7 [Biomphalaria pfeifferi]